MNTFILLTAGFAVLGLSTSIEVRVTLTNTGDTIKGEIEDKNPNRIIIKNSDRWQGDPELVELCNQIQSGIDFASSIVEIGQCPDFAFVLIRYPNYPAAKICNFVSQISLERPADEGQGLTMAFSFKRSTPYDPSKNRNLFFAILKGEKEYRVRCVVDVNGSTMEIQKYYYPEGVWNDDNVQAIYNDVDASCRGENKATFCFANSEAQLVTSKWTTIDSVTKSGNPATIKISWGW